MILRDATISMYMWFDKYIFYDKLVSPINGYECKRLSCQNIKNFGFSSMEEFHKEYPGFPTKCEKQKTIYKDCLQAMSVIGNEVARQNKIKRIEEYKKSPKLCIKCGKSLSYEQLLENGVYCGRVCANENNNGKTLSEETKQKIKQSLREHYDADGIVLKKNTTIQKQCIMCNKNFYCNYNSNAKTCSSICRTAICTKKSRENPNCGGQKRTHRTYFNNIIGDSAYLESSFEVRLATILNNMNILWTRPSYLWYLDKTTNKRRYYPDFYLPIYNVYLDPKNDFLIKTDSKKIESCAEYNNVKIFILSDNMINESYITEFIQKIS